MRYVVRKERAAWIVRDTDGQFMAGHKTHATAINWANTLATTPARRRATTYINRIRAALTRIENQ